MRAFPTPPTAMLGSLYGAKITSTKTKTESGFRFANLPNLLDHHQRAAHDKSYRLASGA